jgi:PAS domain S-box-containing protein
MKILVIEDDETVAEALVAVLSNQNYAVEVANDGNSAWDLIETFDYDLIILDVVLPGLDGISLCRKIRSFGMRMPILLLTGRDSSHDKAVGLDAGADDYLVKPFDIEEFVARIRALLRRIGSISQPVLEWGKLRLDPTCCEVTYDGQLLALTPKEYALLELFLRNSRRVFSCGMILEHLWSYEDTPGEEAVRTHIKGLRHRLKAVGAAHDFIETVYGIGYRLKPKDLTSADSNSVDVNSVDTNLKQEAAASEKRKSKTSKASENHNTQNNSTSAQILASVGAIWHRFKGRVSEQVSVIEEAIAACQNYNLNSQLRVNAAKEAHTLAGSLGTFGFPEGSKLAKEIEQLLTGDRQLEDFEISRLVEIVIALRREIEKNQNAGEDEVVAKEIVGKEIVDKEIVDKEIVGRALITKENPEERPLLLVVDSDNEITQEIESVSVDLGLQITIAENITVARNKLYQEHPSIVLLDPNITTNREDSFRLLEELKARKPPVPAIAFTAEKDFRNRLEAARHGVRTFLQKPAPARQVLETVNQVLQQAEDNADAKVLVVDDDPKILALLQTLLRPWGLQVITLQNPSQFWEKLETSKPDLLILDVQMPDVSGIEICQVVRNDPNWSELPIVFLTVHNDAETVSQVFAVGADDFVNKPIIGPELVTRIVNRLERVKLQRRITQNQQTCVLGESEDDYKILRENEERLRLALDAANIGIWDWNIVTNQVIWSSGHENLFGFPLGTFDGRYETFMACVLPEDRTALLVALNKSQKGHINYYHQYRIACPDGNVRWIEGRGKFLYTEAGEAVRMLGTVRDITDYKEIEKTLSSRICQQATVARLGRSALLGKDLVGLMQEAAALVAKNLDVEYCKVLELLPSGNSLLLRAGVGWGEELMGKAIISFDDSGSGFALKTKKPVLIKDLSTENRFKGSYILHDHNIISGLSVPIPKPNGSYGVLGAYTTKQQNFTQRDIHFVQAIANILSAAMERKQTEQALQEAKEELEVRVAERTSELIAINQRLQDELSDRLQTQEALQKSEALFAGIVGIADDAIITIDTNQCITLFNQGAEKIFGYMAAEVLGKPLDLLLPSRYSQAHQKYVQEFGKSSSKARRMAERREIYGRNKDGREFPSEASISKLKVGNEILYTVYLQDISERKQIERMKDEFISVVSHELRTPLTSIHGSLGMISSGLIKPDTEQGKRLLQIATDSTERLVRLINDILDIERIESGKVKMEKQTCNLGDLIDTAIDLMQPLARQGDVTLSVSSISTNIWADPDRIIQTLTNLLSNAIKFSKPGSTVTLTTEVGNEETNIDNQHISASFHNNLILQIKDNGRGIPTDKLETIFERFQQVDSSDSRKHDGTGLGLAICKSIVQQHGGRIWAESILGEGSSFYFTIPLSIPQHPDLKDLVKNSNEVNDSPLILICDDDPEVTNDLRITLEKNNYRVITASNGEEAINIASLQHPSVILLDLIMPGMNGWEIMAALKNSEDTKNIPIIICSIGKPINNSEDNQDYVEWVCKPVEETSLFQSLQQVLTNSSKQVKVLVVEDDPELAELLATLLKSHEIETCVAKTGREAIQKSQEINPDLLILDVILPEGDGFAVVEWLQQHNRLYNIPLVVYSAKDLDESERQRLKLGYTEFLTKGRVTTEQFEQRVMGILQSITQIPAGDFNEYKANFSD